MIKIPLKRIAVAALLVCSLTVTTTFAKVTQGEIDDAKEQIDKLKDEKESAQEIVDEISDKKEELEDDLDLLNEQMTILVSAINVLENEIQKKQDELTNLAEELDLTKRSLEAAQNRQEKQYESMKVRIQYMYENGSMSMLELLFVSDSLPDFLNKSEYVSEINAYDREKLEEFARTQEQIALQQTLLEQQEDTVQNENEQLLVLQEQMKGKQDEVNALIRMTQEHIVLAGQELTDAKEKVTQLDSKIVKMQEYEKKLEEQKAKEDAARMEEIKRQEAENNKAFSYVPQESDLYLLGAIIQCEAEGEPYEGKLAVGSVVLNRVKSSYFPNTISGVIYQSGQFSPVASGRYAYRLSKGVNQECMQAAQEVLNGRITNNCLYFRTVIAGINGTIIGNHIFY